MYTKITKGKRYTKMDNFNGVIAEMEWEALQIEKTINRILSDMVVDLEKAKEQLNNNPGRPTNFSYINKVRDMGELSSLQSERNSLLASIAKLRNVIKNV